MLSDKEYTDRINTTLGRWQSFHDISTRSVGLFTLVMMTYVEEYIARFFDGEHFPEHARLAVKQDKKRLRHIQELAADLRRNCAPQMNTEYWPMPVVREAVERYKQQGVAHDLWILRYTLDNYLLSQHLKLPAPLFDLYLCACLIRLIDINVDCYSRALIDIDPMFADILNVAPPSTDQSAPGRRTPLHLLDSPDTKLHSRLRRTDPQLHRELSHRRFARTKPLRLAIADAVNHFYGHLHLQLPDTGTLVGDKDLSPVGQAAVIMLNRVNRTDFIRRATEPYAWEEFDRIEKDYRDWLEDNEREHDLEAVHEWKLQSEVCGEYTAAVVAVKRFKTASLAPTAVSSASAERSPAALWLDICADLEEQWLKNETEARRAFDTEREATAKLHPDWTAEKVERAVSQIQYGIHEAALMYDVNALRHHLENHRPKGVTKKALQHERVQRRKAAKTKSDKQGK